MECLTNIPQQEKLLDYELGYTYRSEWFTAGVNLYYMDYTDQLVLNGKTNDIGEAMAENVKDSYRMGVELSLGAKFNDWLRWDLNGTWSKNRIKNYVGYVYDESLVNGEIVDELIYADSYRGWKHSDRLLSFFHRKQPDYSRKQRTGNCSPVTICQPPVSRQFRYKREFTRRLFRQSPECLLLL